jgi:putative endonuclease
MEYYVYAIQSQKDGRIYVGMSENVELRIITHNNGRVFSTKGFLPWLLIYKEFVGERKNARVKEKYYKSGCGKEFLKRLAKDYANNKGL